MAKRSASSKNLGGKERLPRTPRPEPPLLFRSYWILFVVVALWSAAAFVPCVVIVRGTKIEYPFCWIYGVFTICVLILTLAGLGFAPAFKGKGVEFQTGTQQ